MRVLWTMKRSKPVHFNRNSNGCFSKGSEIKFNFSHIMEIHDSLEKHMLLEMTQGERRREPNLDEIVWWYNRDFKHSYERSLRCMQDRWEQHSLVYKVKIVRNNWTHKRRWCKLIGRRVEEKGVAYLIMNCNAQKTYNCIFDGL